MSRYEAASGSFQVVVNLDRQVSWLPSFVAGSQTLFVGQGTDIAFVDFSKLKDSAIKVSHNRRAVSIRVPRARLEPATLDVKRSYVFAEQQGLELVDHPSFLLKGAGRNWKRHSENAATRFRRDLPERQNLKAQ